jgi:quinol monooxygenase YgiN
VKMPNPIIFISHNKIKAGKFEALEAFNQEAMEMIKAEKPRTQFMYAYLSADNSMISFVHMFADVEALDLHMQGAGERAEKAYEYIEPAGMEIYGAPSDGVLEAFRRIEASWIPVRFNLTSLGGFIN